MLRNTGSTPQEWYDLHHRTAAEVERALYDYPPFIERFIGKTRDGARPYVHIRPPARSFVCPEGHPLVRVTIEIDGNWHLYLAATENGTGHVERALVVAAPATWGTTSWRTVCAEPGCPALVAHPNPLCPEHDFPEVLGENTVHVPRIALDCRLPKCRYRGVKSHTELLVQFAIAIITGRHTVRLTD